MAKQMQHVACVIVGSCCAGCGQTKNNTIVLGLVNKLLVSRQGSIQVKLVKEMPHCTRLILQYNLPKQMHFFLPGNTTYGRRKITLDVEGLTIACILHPILSLKQIH